MLKYIIGLDFVGEETMNDLNYYTILTKNN